MKCREAASDPPPPRRYIGRQKMSNVSNFAMFRLNLWAKPFLGVPPQGNPVMDSSSFVPNPLTSPALMVLASTSDGNHDARLSGSHPFSGQTVEKDIPVPFSTSSFIYRPGEPFPPPMYAPPFVQSNLDRGVGLINSGGSSAFRPVASSTEVVDEYQSAFLPAKKCKQDEQVLLNLYNSSERLDQNYGQLRDEKAHATVKEERPSSLSSATCDTVSEDHSEAGDLTERTTPDEGRSLRKQRRKIAVDGHTPCCPVCGLTLRTGEAEAHYALELEKLDKINKGGRKSRDSTPQNRKSQQSPSTSRRGKDSPTPEFASQQRYETYVRIKCNRQSRLSARSRNKKKKSEEAVCPVCNEKVTGTPQELNAHAEQCLRKKEEIIEDETVDVEGDGEQFDEYTWAGQTRIRVTSMLQGGFAGSGFQTSSSVKIVDEDVDLNVDGDDTEQYGTAQYSELDVVPCSADGPDEDLERRALRGALLGIGSSAGLGNFVVEDRTKDCSSTKTDVDNTEKNNLNRISQPLNSAQEIITALKTRLKEKEAQMGEEKLKCLICMEPYKVPLTSVQCWHVHCEECWLRTLGARKLCPQCNMITSPTDLRRIYL